MPEATRRSARKRTYGQTLLHSHQHTIQIESRMQLRRQSLEGGRGEVLTILPWLFISLPASSSFQRKAVVIRIQSDVEDQIHLDWSLFGIAMWLVEVPLPAPNLGYQVQDVVVLAYDILSVFENLNDVIFVDDKLVWQGVLDHR